MQHMKLLDIPTIDGLGDLDGTSAATETDGDGVTTSEDTEVA